MTVLNDLNQVQMALLKADLRGTSDPIASTARAMKALAAFPQLTNDQKCKLVTAFLADNK